MKPILNSAYICVKDMNRAIKFYEQFLEQQVNVKDDLFSIFNLDGFNFCLFNPEKVKEKVTYGDNCLLSFKVDNIDDLQKKLDDLKVEIVYSLTKIGANLVIEFKDPEGNDIEVYSPC
ncbi:MAG: VOC family protein [Candidatus Daviesbacteria bacterium]|nr:VOC family protein [Candidatus Daviesbacteria bacterium]